MYIFCNILLYRIVWWFSQCTSRCNVLNRIKKRFAKNLYSKFIQDSHCIFKEASVLKAYRFYKFNVASFLYNIFKQRRYPMFRPSLGISYPSHNYLMRNSNGML